MNFNLTKKHEQDEVAVVAPAVSIEESENDLLLEAEMSGVEKDDVGVELKDKELVIRAIRREHDVPKGYVALYRERGPYRYERIFVLGDDVDAEKISAVYENGVLRLKLPKAQKPQLKKITVA